MMHKEFVWDSLASMTEENVWRSLVVEDAEVPYEIILRYLCDTHSLSSRRTWTGDCVCKSVRPLGTPELPGGAALFTGAIVNHQ